MPGVDDGGEPLLLAPSGKVTLASDGRPLRIEVARFTRGRRDRARALSRGRAASPTCARRRRSREAGPLLAGPVRIARGGASWAGNRLGFVGNGEPFEIGLGTDDAVRVRRDQNERRETTAVTGTQKLRRP